MNILGLIPARGGSKGLPGKNIAPLGGKPLIEWTIEASLDSSFITETLVSTDDADIKQVSLNAGVQVLDRPADISGDDATSQSVVLHAIEAYKQKNRPLDYVVLLQPTSPFRDQRDIDSAFSKYFDEKASSLISVNPMDNKILKAFVEEKDGAITGIRNNEFPFMRRQDLPNTYMSNGAIYIVDANDFVDSKSFYSTPCIPFEMQADKSIDIDNQLDLDAAENHLFSSE